MTNGSAEKRNVFLLVGMQALFQTASVMVMTISGLVGQILAQDKRLATVPIALMVVAVAATMIPASLFMRKFGRKAGFILGITIGFKAGLLAALAIWQNNFSLFVIANMLVGCYQGFATYYRFAAADAASENFKSRAISWVVAGGIFAALAGPNIARFTRDVGPVKYMAPYLCMSALAIVALSFAFRVTIAPLIHHKDQGSARTLLEIMRQPTFLTAVTSSSIGFSLMIMIMTATPLAMQVCGFSLDSAASVIQWHVLAMFAPSFFTGNLIRRFGVIAIMTIGVILFATHVVLALNGIDYGHFVSGLMLVGVGWNFLYVGGTTLLTKAYRPVEQAKTQAAHDLIMFTCVSFASFSAGSALQSWGWRTVNLISLPLLMLTLAMIGIFFLLKRNDKFSAAMAAPSGN